MLRLPVRAADGLLDRLLRGRAWVVLVGALLAGIVALNVHLLAVNGEIARMSEAADALKRENSDLRIDVARLGSTERIRRVAEARGFVMPAPGKVTYLEPDPSADAARAAAAMDEASVRSSEPAGNAAATSDES